MVYEATFIHINLSKNILNDPPLMELKLTIILPPFPLKSACAYTPVKRPLDRTDNKLTEINIQYGLYYFAQGSKARRKQSISHYSC